MFIPKRRSILIFLVALVTMGILSNCQPKWQAKIRVVEALNSEPLSKMPIMVNFEDGSHILGSTNSNGFFAFTTSTNTSPTKILLSALPKLSQCWVINKLPFTIKKGELLIIKIDCPYSDNKKISNIDQEIKYEI